MTVLYVFNIKGFAMSYRYKNTEFTEQGLRTIWGAGRKSANLDPDVYRQDICGLWMKFDRHGQGGKYGWEIDHIKPVALNGGDEFGNLQPLHWRNNRRKGDTYPWNC